MIEEAKTQELSFTTLKFYPKFVVSTVKENILLDEEHINTLKDAILEHYQNKPFIYLANRVNSYSVNPLIYVNLIQLQVLKGIGIISEDLQRLKTANFEKQFASFPFELFQNKDEAKAWAHRLMKSY